MGIKFLKFAVITVFAAFGFYSAAAGFLAVQSQTAEASVFGGAEISDKELYEQHCASCHGADGSGKGRTNELFSPPDLSTEKFQRKHSDQKIARKISKGGGGMPGFAKKLSTSEINSLVGYIRTLKK